MTLSLWGLRPQFPIIPALPEPGKAANSQTHKILETYLLGTWQWNEITNFFFSLIFWPCHVASGILVSQQGVEPTSPALEAQRLNHWMTREVPRAPILNNIITIVRRCSIPGIESITYFQKSSLVAQRLKRLPGMQETRVRSLGWEDPLEKEMATHSSTLAWRSPWREEPGRLQSTGSQRVGHD